MKVRHANASPMDDLAPAFDALKLGYKFITRQFQDIVHSQKQARSAHGECRTAFASLFFAARHPTAAILVLSSPAQPSTQAASSRRFWPKEAASSCRDLDPPSSSRQRRRTPRQSRRDCTVDETPRPRNRPVVDDSLPVRASSSGHKLR